MSEDLLDSLLAAVAEDEPESATKPSFDNVLSSLDNTPHVGTADKPKQKLIASTIHTGDTDSSDDDDNRDFENRKYNQYGREIKQLLDSPASSKTASTTKSSSWTQKSNPVTSVSYEPLFGIRVINPLVATNVLEERMTGREFVPLNRIKMFIRNISADKDWVVVGVIVHKSATKTSQKGKSFSVWTLSDLKVDLKSACVFLFGRAHEQLWKTSVGTVVGILNPSVLDLREGSKDDAHLSVNNQQLVMILGQSKDLGTCKSIKKSGERCTAFVNLSVCEFCLFHVKSEYQKCSKRSDLQSGFGGHGLTALRNKVLGKNQVFYAGKLYSSTKTNKQTAKDEGRLRVLAGFGEKQKLPKKTQKQKVAAQLELQAGQRQRDLERLKQLGINTPLNLDNNIDVFDAEHSRDVSIRDSRSYALDVIKKLKHTKTDVVVERETNVVAEREKDKIETLNEGVDQAESAKKPAVISQHRLVSVPILTSSGKSVVDLNSPIVGREKAKAKKIALAWVQNNGPIKKQDPNNIRGTGKANKRVRDDADLITDEKRAKIQKNDFFSDRFKKMIATTSSHDNLLTQMEDEKQQQYFQKLEMKERMEEKMSSTYKVPCKAVKCLKCKYTNFSASDLCKTEKHPLRVFDAMKRFFKCGNCGNRTACLSVVPTTACKNCGSGKWERTGMMKERKERITAPTLSIRGGEQKFVNSVAADANLDLLVPE